MVSRLLAIIFCFCVAPTFGQTLSEINLKYGNPTYSYSVSQHIWMTPDFAGDGQVCRMRLYPKHIGTRTDYLAPQLYFEELNGALIKLVPLESRGLKREAFGLTDFGAGAAWTTYAYEKVTFVFTFRFRIDPGVQRKSEPIMEPLEILVTELAQLGEKTPPSIDDFAPSRSTQTEIVTILWNERKGAR